MRVAVVMGGWSSEREVSVASGMQVAAALMEYPVDVSPVILSRDNLLELLNAKPDLVFNALHGIGGEDGALQGFLDVMKIAYTHSGIQASAVAIDKPLTKVLAQSLGIKCSEGEVIGRSIPNKHPMIPPYVVKPTRDGSTIGIRVIRTEQEAPCGGTAWTHSSPMMVERYVHGVDLSVGLINGKAIDVIEIRSANGVYDFESKYTTNKAEHILPACIPEEVRRAALWSSEKLWQLLGCQDLSRVDFRYDPSTFSVEGLYFLEVNTHPGLTKTSLLPEMAAANGISFGELIWDTVERAKCRNIT